MQRFKCRLFFLLTLLLGLGFLLQEVGISYKPARPAAAEDEILEDSDLKLPQSTSTTFSTTRSSSSRSSSSSIVDSSSRGQLNVNSERIVHKSTSSPSSTKAAKSFKGVDAKLRKVLDTQHKAEMEKMVKEDAAFYEIPRLSPKVTYALADTVLNKPEVELRENRRIAKILDDPKLLEKLRKMEDHRQSVYVNLIKTRGQYFTLDDGQTFLISNAKNVIHIPGSVKFKAVDKWTDQDKLWTKIVYFPWSHLPKTSGNETSDILSVLKEEIRKTFSPSAVNQRENSINVKVRNDEIFCNRTMIRFPGETGFFRPVAIASYPASGNTWLRYLVEGVTGYFTGSIYNDVTLSRKGYYGESILSSSGLVLGIKTHGHTTGTGMAASRENQTLYFNHFSELGGSEKRCVLLVRNPYEAIVGHRNLDEGGHTGFAEEKAFKGPGWEKFVHIKIRSWKNFYLDWLEHTPKDRIHVVIYERLKAGGRSLETTLRDASDFLLREGGLQVSGDTKIDEGRMKCVLEHGEGAFHRNKDSTKKPKLDPNLLFYKRLRTMIQKAIMEVNDALMAKGLTELPVDEYERFFEKKH